MDWFAVIIDAYSGGNTHCVVVFITFSLASHSGYDSLLLVLLAMGKKVSFNAEKHYEFFSLALIFAELFPKNWRYMWPNHGFAYKKSPNFWDARVICVASRFRTSLTDTQIPLQSVPHQEKYVQWSTLIQILPVHPPEG